MYIAIVVTADGSQTYVALINGDCTFAANNYTHHASGSWATEWVKLSGEFNGDGKTDFYISNTDTSNGWRTYVALGNGDGTFAPKNYTQHASGSWATAWLKLSGNFTGDGKSDVYISKTDPSNGWRTYVALGN